MPGCRHHTWLLKCPRTPGDFAPEPSVGSPRTEATAYKLAVYSCLFMFIPQERNSPKVVLKKYGIDHTDAEPCMEGITYNR